MIDELLKGILIHAYNTVSFYKESYDEAGINPEGFCSTEDFHRVPLVTKNDVQLYSDKFFSSDYAYYPKRDDIIVTCTSGSTGRLLKLNWSKQDIVRAQFNLWKVRMRVYGVHPKSKFFSFHSVTYGGNKAIEAPEIIIDDMGRHMSVSRVLKDEKYLEKYYGYMMDFGPEWIMTMPSTMYLLARFISDNGLTSPKTLKYIELSGEYLFDRQREKIRETFNVPVANMYGSEETNGIAIECRSGHMHCMGDNVYVEILKDGNPARYGEEGDVYVTSLTNTAMPFIRYSQGDRAILYPPETCSCGNQNPVIKVSAGRIGQNVLIEGREPLGSFVFCYAFEVINRYMKYPVLQFQVIQETMKRFTVRLVIRKSFEGWKDAIQTEFIGQMEKLGLSNLDWQFDYENNIMPSPVSGKLQFFVNKVEVNI